MNKYELHSRILVYKIIVQFCYLFEMELMAMYLKLKSNAQNGMSLVEVLAALAILGIVMIGLMTVFPQMTLFNSKTKEKLDTMNLAKQELVKLQGANDLLFDKTIPETTTDYERYIYDDNGYRFEVDYYIQPDLIGNSDTAGTKTLSKVHIKVKKQGASEQNRVISETFGYFTQ
jgi:prepilin-type N-terminal cleavage/methylation domain-containing protein